MRTRRSHGPQATVQPTRTKAPLGSKQARLANQAARIQTLDAFRSRDDVARLREFIDQELRVLRAVSIAALAGHQLENSESIHHNETMKLIRAVSTALRAVLTDPQSVDPAGPTSAKVRRLQAQLASARAEGRDDDPNLVRELLGAAGDAAREDKATSARQALVEAANEICKRAGHIGDAVPFKLSRPVMKTRGASIVAEALARDYAAATAGHRDLWTKEWLQELRDAGAPDCSMRVAMRAYRQWLRKSSKMSRAENVAMEVLMRVYDAQTAFVEHRELVRRTAADVAERLSAPGSLNDAETVFRICAQTVSGGDLRNMFNFRDKRAKRAGERARATG